MKSLNRYLYLTASVHFSTNTLYLIALTLTEQKLRGLKMSEKCGSLEGGVAKINRHYSVERFPWWDEERGVRFPSHFQSEQLRNWTKELLVKLYFKDSE